MFNEKNKQNIKNFTLSERMGYFPNDNLINYTAGPIIVNLNIKKSCIHIKSTIGADSLFDEVISLIVRNWKIKNSQIKKFPDEIVINYDFTILKNYLSMGVFYNDHNAQPTKLF